MVVPVFLQLTFILVIPGEAKVAFSEMVNDEAE